MKRIALLASLLFGLALVGCPSTSEDEASSPPVAEAPAKVYECPMHCVPEGESEEYTASEPGSCPVCGMDLEERD